MQSLAARVLDWRIGRTGPVEFAFAFLAGLFMAAIGAFDSETMPAATRYAYWLLAMVGGSAVAALVEAGLWRVPALAQRPPLLALAQVVAMTPPISAVVWTIHLTLLGHLMPLRLLPRLVVSVFVVDIAVVILAVLIRRATRRIVHPPQPASANAVPHAIAAKLAPRLARAELLAVQAEDHYLRVHTAEGDALVLMRFADALAALKGCDGVRVHRSWWVARRAVDEVRFSRGRGELGLRNGLKAPVSRTYAAELRSMGWA
jgi:hypothetical protein